MPLCFIYASPCSQLSDIMVRRPSAEYQMVPSRESTSSRDLEAARDVEPTHELATLASQDQRVWSDRDPTPSIVVTDTSHATASDPASTPGQPNKSAPPPSSARPSDSPAASDLPAPATQTADAPLADYFGSEPPGEMVVGAIYAVCALITAVSLALFAILDCPRSCAIYEAIATTLAVSSGFVLWGMLQWSETRAERDLEMIRTAVLMGIGMVIALKLALPPGPELASRGGTTEGCTRPVSTQATPSCA